MDDTGVGISTGITTIEDPAAPAADRYRSFKGIDCDGQASRMMARIAFHTQAGNDRFCAYFFERRHAQSGMRCDDLLLLASFVNQIRELFETRGDEIALAWLDQLENECF
ncbi:MAG: N(2)-fixation sustaining protein CowN [Rhodoferax sp.]|jgi:hypothetical protein|nr:N(2)-fixation sustaining protein CowN [Rhodoferax sp.]